jgi:hypothetical protein
MRAVILGVSALAVCLAGSLGVLQAADGPAVTIAVLRGDGVLVPIVTRIGTKWTGTKWTNTWPVPAKAADVPLGLEGIPKRWWGKPGETTTWHAWQIDGATGTIAVERPTWYLAHCQQGIGLQTSLTARPPIPPPTVQPYPKLGLASTAPLVFKRIQPVDQNDPIWMKVVDAVGAATNKAEDAMDGRPAMNASFRPKHPTPAAERGAVATRIEALYRLPRPAGQWLYYVEATKRYGMPPLPADKKAPAPSPQKGCSVMTYANGFFVATADGVIPPPSLNARVTSCDYDTVSLVLPLAAVGEGDEQVFIGQVTGWDYESYAGFRWDEQGKIADVFFTHGGWCQDQ